MCPLTLISPWNITPESNIRVMQIREFVINYGSFLLVSKFFCYSKIAALVNRGIVW